MNWEALNLEIKKCSKCEGLNSEKLGTQNAPGYGNRKSKVAFIGQSLCGKPCIDAQIPFTGGSGRLLDEAFDLAGIEKRDIYITNVVKCHPPDNRKSEDYEISNCTPYLDRELSWISPSTIVCLGKDAWKYLDESVSKPGIENTTHLGRNITAHFMYHPSYLMKCPRPKREKYLADISNIICSNIA